MAENLAAIKVEVQLPEYCWGFVEQGSIQGKIVISSGDYILEEIPLVADRSLKKKGGLYSFSDKLILSALDFMNR